jgi:hypothetical protein
MLTITGVTTTIVKTRPLPLSIFRLGFSWGYRKNIQVVDGVGQVRPIVASMERRR